MNIQNYLQDKLETCSGYILSDQEKLDSAEDIEGYIYQKLTSKKFRKWKVDDSSEKRVKEAIHLNVSQSKPIQFTFPFGGYKLWHMPTSPEVDWAEVFMIAYYCSYMAPIVAAYQQGVEFHFSSDDIIIERMDNVPKADTEAYVASFRKLLMYFQKYFPSNLHMSLERVADLYPNKDEFEKELSENLQKEQFIKAGEDENMLKLSRLNIQWKGKEDWSVLSEQEKANKITQGPIYHHAYCAVTRRRAFVRGEDKIVIFCTPISDAIAVGTTKTSVTKFWTGLGVLEKVGDSFRNRVLSPSQWEKAKDQKHEEVKIDLINLKNFSTIKIYPPFNFV